MSASKSKNHAEDDLDLVRERLSFYEQFDEIIRQNIASSSALLKEASARLDRDFAAERNRYRSLLSDILDDLTVLQAQSEKLARRVTDALDELEGSAAPSLESVAPGAMGIAAEAPPEAAAVVNAAAGGTRRKTDAAKASARTTETDKSTGKATDAPTLAPDAQATPEPVAESVVAISNPTTTTLLVHGVPRASAALGLKSYIENLDFVTAVEPREFAAGLLRLQVDATRPLAVSDLSGWNLADRIELRNASNELLELNLIPA